MTLMFEKEAYRIRGAAYEVYKQMGNGYVEPVYQECMEKHFQPRNAGSTRKRKGKIEEWQDKTSFFRSCRRPTGPSSRFSYSLYSILSFSPAQLIRHEHEHRFLLFLFRVFREFRG